MVDPGIHAEMTILVKREKELHELIETFEKEELPLWNKRVKLAEQKGMLELASEAEQRVRQLEQKLSEAELELDSIAMQKSMLRKESRRPTGQEVARSEALLEQIRMTGLVDPDRKDWEDLEKRAGSPRKDDGTLQEDSGAVFDFSDDD